MILDAPLGLSVRIGLLSVIWPAALAGTLGTSARIGSLSAVSPAALAGALGTLLPSVSLVRIAILFALAAALRSFPVSRVQAPLGRDGRGDGMAGALAAWWCSRGGAALPPGKKRRYTTLDAGPHLPSTPSSNVPSTRTELASRKPSTVVSSRPRERADSLSWPAAVARRPGKTRDRSPLLVYYCVRWWVGRYTTCDQRYFRCATRTRD
ncbi:MAG: hypothetical protein BJ554DRAFT_1716 [Olpidium bornovanus]|uniref:Uncharacterized protein n=1 Tax=Olpidium bornovanus TaxID=278681 RepID=A0A8H8DMX3_9FUNG|nr:MAG: hypothetical protein BJ554DRAFT_1716 [Olpidium bornovanus]